MTGRVAGKTALVTGAARGIGAATAQLLAREGAKVLLTDIDAAGAAAQAEAIDATCGEGAAFSTVHDVTLEADWLAALDLARGRLGGLSVLVNNAGIGIGGTIESCSLEQWRRSMAVNADGAFLGCKQALPLLRESQPAAIVNISSIAAVVGSPELLPYSAAKAAVGALTRSVALHCAAQRWDIRCNSVHPAFVDTAMLDGFRADPRIPRAAVLGHLAGLLPIGRVAAPDEIAQAVLYLASDDSRFMTGAELRLDGGLSAM